MKAYFNQVFRFILLIFLLVFLFTSGKVILYFSNREIFEAFNFSEVFNAIFKGLEYDLLVVVFINSLFTFLFFWPARIYNSKFYQFLLKLIFFLFNAFALLIHLLDVRLVKLSGHRLRAFEFVEEMNYFLGELQSGQLTDFIIRYLHLTVYFFVFLVILGLSLKLINKQSTEYDYKRKVRKWTSLLLPIIVTGIFVLSNFGKEQLLGNLYLKADRKLAPLVINNPYLLIQTYGEKQMDISGDFGSNEFPSKKKYDSETGGDFKKIHLIITEQKGAEDIIKDDNFFPVYTLRNKYQSVFQLLDEVFLSFPGVYTNGFYLSPYSLNRFESLVDFLKKKGYNVKLTSVGYPLKVEKLIRNFYGFGNNKSKNEKTFEVVLINAMENDNNTFVAGTDIINENELIIRLSFGKNQETDKDDELKRSISFTSLTKLPFYKPVDSIISQPIDIKPGILQLIGYNEAFTAYGSSLFAPDEKILFQCISDSSSMVLMDSLLLGFSNNQTTWLNKLKGMKIIDMDFKDSLAVERIILENKIHSIINNFKQKLKNNSL